ncbi:2-keto-4-pentenoate hydratase [Candidatus Electrothrix aarhusensis]|uniref:2-keto-4-pentenoate hydratase n=1 Tax=Candidatus Electrothrix aarhusensis TaxID=1859131 RepID=A0A444IZ33_9BACT|nr:2-keto-4-pentenoate hydratase [Candidatus Electrothrix aarhusensis]
MKTRNITITCSTLCALLCLLPLHLFAVCPPAAEIEARATAFLEKRPLDLYSTELSLADAYCAQEKYVAALIPRFGQPIGYKVGFTSKGLQERFQIEGPALGVLLEKMLLPDGATFSLDSAYRPVIEPDLVVTIKDEGIMAAQNELEVAAHLDELRPFLELPAISFTKETQLSGTTLVACNIAARAGVAGAGRKVEATPAFVQALADMETVFTDETGALLQKEPGSNLLGHPLQAVLWLIEELQARGETLHAGQVISLGGFGKLFPLKEAGKTYTLTYMGLPGGPLSTSVTISE